MIRQLLGQFSLPNGCKQLLYKINKSDMRNGRRSQCYCKSYPDALRASSSHFHLVIEACKWTQHIR